MMHITEIDIPIDEDERESFLASYAVYLANQKARVLGFPRYYVKDGYLVEERNGKFKKLKRITKTNFMTESNLFYGGV